MTVEDYLKNLNPKDKALLEAIRKQIYSLIPEATERISYKMPCFYYKNRYLVGIGSFSNHLSLFPGNEPINVFVDRIKGYKTTKGSIHFTKDKPLAVDLIEDIIKYRKQVIDNNPKAK